jgi:ATP-dependent Clp protease adaptor protein ClpS
MSKAATKTITKEKVKQKTHEETQLVPQYNVVLLDDNDHTYEYVVEMLMKLFGHTYETAYQMACEVDETGRVIVFTTSKERAEFKRDQIHAYGADWRIERCKGSMSAIIEPANPI